MIFLSIIEFYIYYIQFKAIQESFNPISTYSAIWVLVALYELKLVHYYDLTMYTWLIIILFQLLYNIMCFLGDFETKIWKYYNPKN